jgi:hypothetical protein
VNADVLFHNCGKWCGLQEIPAKFGLFHPQAGHFASLAARGDADMLAVLFGRRTGRGDEWSTRRNRLLN